MSKNRHKEAIRHITREDLDWFDVATIVAEIAPATFLKAIRMVELMYQSQNNPSEDQLHKEVSSAYFSAEPPSAIAAIKAYRRHTGSGLKEAHDYVTKHFTQPF